MNVKNQCSIEVQFLFSSFFVNVMNCGIPKKCPLMNEMSIHMRNEIILFSYTL
jgi:hypothetical protein